MLENLEQLRQTGQVILALVVLGGAVVVMVSWLFFAADNESVAMRFVRCCGALAGYVVVAGLALHVYTNSLPDIDRVVYQHQNDQVTSSGH